MVLVAVACISMVLVMLVLFMVVLNGDGGDVSVHNKCVLMYMTRLN